MNAQQPTTPVQLGSSDLQVSPLGIGTWAWGDRMYWGYGKGYTNSDLRTAFEIGVGAGVTFFDTAEVYGLGQSERLLGDFARSATRPVVIASKFYPFPWRLSPHQFRSALRASLKRLGVERVDLYYIHWPLGPRPIDVWVSALANVVEMGLARAAGVSNFNVEQMRRAHAILSERGIPLAANQVHYSLLHREPERSGLLDACRELGVSLVAYSPLESGLLTGKYTADNLPRSRMRRSFINMTPERVEAAQPLLNLLREISESHGKTPAEVALNWTICKDTIPIPGAKNARQATANVAALGWQLTNDEVATLDQVSEVIS